MLQTPPLRILATVSGFHGLVVGLVVVATPVAPLSVAQPESPPPSAGPAVPAAPETVDVATATAPAPSAPAPETVDVAPATAPAPSTPAPETGPPAPADPPPGFYDPPPGLYDPPPGYYDAETPGAPPVFRDPPPGHYDPPPGRYDPPPGFWAPAAAGEAVPLPVTLPVPPPTATPASAPPDDEALRRWSARKRSLKLRTWLGLGVFATSVSAGLIVAGTTCADCREANGRTAVLGSLYALAAVAFFFGTISGIQHFNHNSRKPTALVSAAPGGLRIISSRPPRASEQGPAPKARPSGRGLVSRADL
ncbi:hypothetical protein [Nannocystis punicea]|uniref:Uncharacterized protein n=1 Tax=Nannocystis punicea TaxID=2995304 RepID=A0ABY7GUX4_9BACT|nr:hypothetical protein [Nannocystis poenicansa]WAS90743.1 hypothetical protein O0S08_31535 [Nannocystis poenicansa]